VIKRSTLLVLLCLALGVAAGCSKTHSVQVQANSCWAGTINGDQYITGCGNALYKVLGPVGCVRVSPTSGDSTALIRVRLDNGPWYDTRDRYGFVQVCE